MIHNERETKGGNLPDFIGKGLLRKIYSLAA